MNRFAWLLALSLPFATQWACSDRTPNAGGCGDAADCLAGEVCVGTACTRVCRSDVDCGTGTGTICVDDTCQEGTRGGDSAPVITSIDGDTTATLDGAIGHTAHRTAGRLTIAGTNFDGAAVDLVNGADHTTLEICEATSTELVVVLPTELESSRNYGVRVYNQAGECNATLPVLQGEQGIQGIQGIQGNQGIQGVAGAAGAKGDAGGGIVLDLELDETGPSVTEFADSSPYGNKVAPPGGGITAAAGGHTGSAVDFSGGVLWLATPNMPATAQLWVEAWIRPDAPVTGTKTIVKKFGSFVLKQIDANLSFEVTGAGGTCTATSTNSAIGTDGSWYHVAGWYDGLDITVAVNGAVALSTSCAKGMVASSPTGGLAVGGSFSGVVSEPFEGRIDEIRIRHTAPHVGNQNIFARGRVTSAASSYASQRLPVELCTGAGCYSEWLMYNHPTSANAGTPYYRDLMWIQYNPNNKTVSIFRVAGNALWSSWNLGNGPSSWSWYWTSAVGYGECDNMAANGTCNGGDVFDLVSYNQYDVAWNLIKLPD